MIGLFKLLVPRLASRGAAFPGWKPSQKEEKAGAGTHTGPIYVSEIFFLPAWPSYRQPAHSRASGRNWLQLGFVLGGFAWRLGLAPAHPSFRMCFFQRRFGGDTRLRSEGLAKKFSRGLSTKKPFGGAHLTAAGEREASWEDGMCGLPLCV